MTKNKIFYLLVTLLSISIFLSIIFIFNQSDNIDNAEQINQIEPTRNLNDFGFNDDSLNVEKSEVERNQTLSTILINYSISPKVINNLVDISKNVFDVRSIRTGHNYIAYLSQKDSLKLNYFVYEIDPIQYVVFSFRDTLNIYLAQKEVTKKRREVSGVIQHSLYNALSDKDVDPELAINLSDIFAWQIDFFRIQNGDSFKVIYEEEYVDDNPIGISKIIGAYFNHDGEDFYAIRFKGDKDTGYYDENGRSLRKAFLKAPLKFSRISSHYTMRRFHPILHRNKPHLGTDYVAPTGTPIHTVGDGIIIAAQYSRYNGNYVKVKHNSVYTTQYLHMSKIARGIHSGVRVKQGQVIGYVGSTGLATGPHLCYRFWKNGVQVDPFKQKMPPSKPISSKYVQAFNLKKDSVLTKINDLLYASEADSTKPSA